MNRGMDDDINVHLEKVSRRRIHPERVERPPPYILAERLPGCYDTLDHEKPFYKRQLIWYTPLLLFQILLLILICLFVEYPVLDNADKDQLSLVTPLVYIRAYQVYLMMFLGFPLYYSWLKHYAYSGLVFMVVLAGFSLELALIGVIMYDWFKLSTVDPLQITLKQFTRAVMVGLTPLISTGAILGRTTPFQLVFMATVETIIATINSYMCKQWLKLADIGGSIVVHIFGAYFGLAVSYMIGLNIEGTDPRGPITEKFLKLKSASYNTGLHSLVGTFFLICLWPSLNSALTMTNEEDMRAVYNSYLSMFGAYIGSLFSKRPNSKLQLLYFQSAPLAGGVVLGASANMYQASILPFFIGFGTSALTVQLCQRLSPVTDRIVIDTCAINNVFGIPGIIGAIISGILAITANEKFYKLSFKFVFPILSIYETKNAQAFVQMLSMWITMGMAIVGGVITGWIMSLPIFFSKLSEQEVYRDVRYWDIPADRTQKEPTD